jgi:hypothetical protein
MEQPAEPTFWWNFEEKFPGGGVDKADECWYTFKVSGPNLQLNQGE